ncbi:hypothetical protein Ciccas_005641 [Cichlidogyrus casuarinus]|uniref:NADH dehydrogenase subunit 4L n=1 Tax=Cichlidogyrus casuarinus TaxID=1844966 RepID=A0ABD2Q828_9PLAT
MAILLPPFNGSRTAYLSILTVSDSLTMVSICTLMISRRKMVVITLARPRISMEKTLNLSKSSLHHCDTGVFCGGIS